MTASATGGAAADLDTTLAAALLAVPGVSRIEPRLLSSLQRIAKPGADVRPLAVRMRNGRAELAVDISADVRLGSAVAVAVAVQDRAAAVIAEHGLVPGEIDVTVLEVAVLESAVPEVDGAS